MAGSRVTEFLQISSDLKHMCFLFDFVGEFIPQGTIFITLKVSYVVAIVLLVQCYKTRSRKG